MKARCVWCNQILTFHAGHGWLHPDGKLYVTRADDDGVERDDHCALPGAFLPAGAS